MVSILNFVVIKCSITYPSILIEVLYFEIQLINFIILSGPSRMPELDEKIRRLTDMGIEEHNARVALSSYNWDLERATEQLFS